MRVTSIRSRKLFRRRMARRQWKLINFIFLEYFLLQQGILYYYESSAPIINLGYSLVQHRRKSEVEMQGPRQIKRLGNLFVDFV